MNIGFLVNKRFRFIVLLISSFVVASWLSLPLSLHSVKEGKVPECFNVLIYDPPNSIAMKSFNEAKGLSNKTFLLPAEKVLLLNQELARQYTGYGGTWSFEILVQEANKQYIHVTASGDDDIIETWYWATNTHIIPIKYRWLNPGVIFIVIPLTVLLTSLGACFYHFIVCFISKSKLIKSKDKQPSFGLF